MKNPFLAAFFNYDNQEDFMKDFSAFLNVTGLELAGVPLTPQKLQAYAEEFNEMKARLDALDK